MTHKERYQRRQAVAKFIKAGGTIPEAVAKFEIGEAAIRLACLERGVSVPTMGSKLQADMRNEVAKFVREGGTLGEAMEKFGLPFGSVQDICRNYGVGLAAPLLAKSTYVVIADIINTEETFTSIARKRYLSVQRVQQIAAELKKVSIKFPPRPMPPSLKKVSGSNGKTKRSKV